MLAGKELINTVKSQLSGMIQEDNVIIRWGDYETHGLVERCFQDDPFILDWIHEVTGQEPEYLRQADEIYKVLEEIFEK